MARGVGQAPVPSRQYSGTSMTEPGRVWDWPTGAGRWRATSAAK